MADATDAPPRATNRPAHFEFYTPDPAATNRFFAAVFGWKTSKFDGPMDYHLVDTSAAGSPGGINGGVSTPEDGMPTGTVNVIEVADLDATLAAVEKAGGSVCVPRMPIPTIGWLAYAADPAGIMFGMMEPDPSAG